MSRWECNMSYIFHFRQRWNRYIVATWENKREQWTLQFNGIEQHFLRESDITLCKTPYTQMVCNSKRVFPTTLINSGRSASLASIACMLFRLTLTPYQTRLSMYSWGPYKHSQLWQSKTVTYCTTLPHKRITIYLCYNTMFKALPVE